MLKTIATHRIAKTLIARHLPVYIKTLYPHKVGFDWSTLRELDEVLADFKLRSTRLNQLFQVGQRWVLLHWSLDNRLEEVIVTRLMHTARHFHYHFKQVVTIFVLIADKQHTWHQYHIQQPIFRALTDVHLYFAHLNKIPLRLETPIDYLLFIIKAQLEQDLSLAYKRYLFQYIHTSGFEEPDKQLLIQLVTLLGEKTHTTG